jgi:hypothetical protein
MEFYFPLKPVSPNRLRKIFADYGGIDLVNDFPDRLGKLNFSLLDADGEVFFSKTVRSFTGYSATGTTVATERSKRDAYDRLMVILAKQVSNYIRKRMLKN